jgi:hypothetical protein
MYVNVYSSKLELEEHGQDDELEIVQVPQGKSGKSRLYLYLLLVIIAIIASKSVAQSTSLILCRI